MPPDGRQGNQTCPCPPSLATDIDDAFDTYGLVPALHEGRLAGPVAGKLLDLMPIHYMQELLLPVCGW